MNNKYIYSLLLLAFVWMSPNIFAAETSDSTEIINHYEHYLIEFYDKKESPFSLEKPEQYLSPRAIERRKRLDIAITENDLPVTPSYIEKLKQTQGITIKHVSKWFNLVSVSLDTKLIKTEDLLRLPFVKSVKYIGKTPFSPKAEEKTKDKKPEISIQKANEILITRLMESDAPEVEFSSKYGAALPQIQMLSGDKVHQKGYTGKGVLIAVLDAGFDNVNKIEAFNHLFESNRIIAWRDFVDFDNSVWEDDNHGTNVLSCIAAYLPNKMIGTAPDASFLLIRTENAHSETRMEEISWIAGAEYADSMGADLISSSLGYTQFDEKQFSFTYSMLDGRTTLITRAADLAFDKGIIVMNSAGNEGSSAWQYIGAPADGIKVVASGGVDYNMVRSTFSSIGPSADNRLKPNISAIATNTIVVNTNGEISPSNGTSFSNPVLSGMIACILQAAPDKSLSDILQAVYSSGSHAADGDGEYGWGVPNFDMALAFLKKSESFNYKKSQIFEEEYKTMYAGLTIRYYAAKKQNLKFRIQQENSKGKFKNIVKSKAKLNKGQFFSTPWLINVIQLNKNNIETGNYRLVLRGRRFKHQRNFTINNIQEEQEFETEYAPER